MGNLQSTELINQVMLLFGRHSLYPGFVNIRCRHAL